MKVAALVVHSNKVLVQAFIAMALAFLYSTYANAAPVKSAPAKSAITAKISAPKDQKEKDQSTKFGAALTVSTSTGISESAGSTQERAYSGAYVFTPSVSFAASNISLSADIEYDREYSYELDDGQDGDWANPIFRLRKSVKDLGVVDSLSFGPTVSLPAGREAKRVTFNGSLGGTASVSKKVGLLNLSQAASYTHRFYEYDIRDDGTVNSPHLLSSATGISVEITKWLSIGVDFTFQNSISFQKVNRSSTTTVFSGAFTLSDNASISTGVATLRKGTIQTDGQSNRVNLYDPGTAQAFLDLVLSF